MTYRTPFTRAAHKVLSSISFYPLSTFWLCMMVVVPMVASDLMSLPEGLLTLTLIALILLFAAMQREVNVVHEILSEEQAELLVRIAQLVQLLEEAHIELPEGYIVNRAPRRRDLDE